LASECWSPLHTMDLSAAHPAEVLCPKTRRPDLLQNQQISPHWRRRTKPRIAESWRLGHRIHRANARMESSIGPSVENTRVAVFAPTTPTSRYNWQAAFGILRGIARRRSTMHLPQKLVRASTQRRTIVNNQERTSDWACPDLVEGLMYGLRLYLKGHDDWPRCRVATSLLAETAMLLSNSIFASLRLSFY